MASRFHQQPFGINDKFTKKNLDIKLDVHDIFADLIKMKSKNA